MVNITEIDPSNFLLSMGTHKYYVMYERHYHQSSKKVMTWEDVGHRKTLENCCIFPYGHKVKFFKKCIFDLPPSWRFLS